MGQGSYDSGEDDDYKDYLAKRVTPQDVLGAQKEQNATAAAESDPAARIAQAQEDVAKPTDEESYRKAQNTLGEAGLAAPIRRRYSDSATEQQVAAGEQADVAKTTARFDTEQARTQERAQREREQNMAANDRARAAADAKARRGQMHNFKAAGGVTEFDAAGNEVAQRQPNPQPQQGPTATGEALTSPDVPVYKPGPTGEPPQQDENGQWVVPHRNEYGGTYAMPAENSPHFHEDAQTGEQTYTHNGEKLELGVNKNTVERNTLKTTQVELDRDTQEERIALGDARLRHADAREAVKPFAPQVKKAEAAVVNLERALATAKGAGRAAIEKQLGDARKVLDDPNYLAAKAQLDAADGEVRGHEDAINVRRAKALDVVRDIDKLKAARLLPAGTRDAGPLNITDGAGAWPEDAVTTDAEGKRTLDPTFAETVAAGQRLKGGPMDAETNLASYGATLEFARKSGVAKVGDKPIADEIARAKTMGDHAATAKYFGLSGTPAGTALLDGGKEPVRLFDTKQREADSFVHAVTSAAQEKALHERLDALTAEQQGIETGAAKNISGALTTAEKKTLADGAKERGAIEDLLKGDPSGWEAWAKEHPSDLPSQVKQYEADRDNPATGAWNSRLNYKGAGDDFAQRMNDAGIQAGRVVNDPNAGTMSKAGAVGIGALGTVAELVNVAQGRRSEDIDALNRRTAAYQMIGNLSGKDAEQALGLAIHYREQLANGEKILSGGESAPWFHFQPRDGAMRGGLTLPQAQEFLQALKDDAGSAISQASTLNLFKQTATSALPFVTFDEITADDRNMEEVAKRNALGSAINEEIAAHYKGTSLAGMAVGSAGGFMLGGIAARAAAGKLAAMGALGETLKKAADVVGTERKLALIGQAANYAVQGASFSMKQSPETMGVAGRLVDMASEIGSLALSEIAGDKLGDRLEHLSKLSLPLTARWAVRSLGSGTGELASDVIQDLMQGQNPGSNLGQYAAADYGIGAAMAMLGIHGDVRLRKAWVARDAQTDALTAYARSAGVAESAQETALRGEIAKTKEFSPEADKLKAQLFAEVSGHWGDIEGSGETYAARHGQVNVLRGQLDTARREGDGPKAAALKDQLEQAQSGLASSAAMMLRLDPAVREKAAKLIDPGADGAGLARQLDDNETLRFAALEIGKAMRPLVLPGGKEMAAQAMLGGDAGAHAALDQMIGAQVVNNDVVSVLNGGKIAQGRAEALDRLGLLEMEAQADGTTTMKVTDDALALLPAALREAVANDTTGKYQFKVTAGTPGAMVNNLVKSGEDRLAVAAGVKNSTAEAQRTRRGAEGGVMGEAGGSPAANSKEQRQGSQGGSQPQFRVKLNVALPGGVTRSTAVTVPAANEAEAVKIAVAQAQGSAPKEAKISVAGKVEAIGPSRASGAPATAGGTGRAEPSLQDNPTGGASAEHTTLPAEMSKKAGAAFGRAWERRRGDLAKMGVTKVVETRDGKVTVGGVTSDYAHGPMALQGDTLVFDRPQIAKLIAEAEKQGNDGHRAVADVIVHELIHGVAVQVVTREEAVEIAATAPAKLRALAGKTYANFEKLSAWQQGHELIRLVIEGRYRGKITEQIYQAIDKVLKALGIKVAELPENALLTAAADKVKAALDAARVDISARAESGGETAEAQRTGRGAEFGISTPQGGVKVRGQWKVVEAGELTTSDRPNYNQDLQRRDRGRSASKNQVAKIAHSLDPARLGESATSDTGAPMVNAQGEVLSGNGRTMALRQVFQRGGAKAMQYWEFVEKQAARLGLSTEGIRRPVLVREVTDFGKSNEAEFAELSNRSALLGRSAVETAMDDGKMLLDEGLLDQFQPGENGDIFSAGNRQFNRLFIQHTADRAQLLRGDGTFAPELEGRVRRAILAAIMQRLPEAQEAVTSAVERADKLGLTRQVSGIMAAAGRLLKLQTTNPEMDIAPALAEALAGAIEARGLIESGKAKTVADALGQGALFGEPSAAGKILTGELLGRTSGKAVRELLNEYSRIAENVASGPTMFGEETPGLAPAEVLTNIVHAAEREKARTAAARGLSEALHAAEVTETPAEKAGMDRAMALAEGAKPELDRITAEIAAKFHARAVVVPLKRRARALAKMRGDYAGDASKLKDIARTTIETRGIAQAQAVAAEIEARFGTKAKRNNFLAPLANGYRDALFHVPLGEATVEIQVHVPEVLFAKSHLHQLYERVQDIERTARLEGREPTAAETSLIARLNAMQRRVYDGILGIAPAGSSSAKSSGLQENAPLDSSSSGEMGRGGSASNAKALPPASTTTPNAPSGEAGSGTSLNPTAPGNRAVTSSSVISRTIQGDEGSVNGGALFAAKVEPKKLHALFMDAAGSPQPIDISGGLDVAGHPGLFGRGLGVPRGEMPQLPGSHHAEFLRWLDARGIAHEDVTANALVLKPTQGELDAVRIGKLLRSSDGAKERRSFISSDGYVIDGHHRWAATVATGFQNGKMGMPVTRLGVPIREALGLAREFNAEAGIAARPMKSVGALGAARVDTGTMDLFAQPSVQTSAAQYVAAAAQSNAVSKKDFVKQAKGDGLGAVAEDLFAFAVKNPPAVGTGKNVQRPTSNVQHSTDVNERKAAAADKVAFEVGRYLQRGKAITWQKLFEWSDLRFEGKQADGAYTPKDAYDAMELGVNEYLKLRARTGVGRDFNPTVDGARAAMTVRDLKDIIALLPVQSKRTAEMDEYQQFSTVPSLAYMANWVANLSAEDTVLEPSAGIGGLAVFAKNAGAEVVMNELSPRRAAILRKLGIGPVFTENAEQIDNVLPADVRPTVVVMNPPFSATAGRMQGSRDTANATRHIEQALARLPEGGRLVAIVGEGMKMDGFAFKAWWEKMQRENTVRANVQVSGQEYAKYGTTFDNQIVVIDKGRASDVTVAPVVGRVEKVEDLIPLLESIRNERRPSHPSTEGALRPGAGPDSAVSAGPGRGGATGTQQRGVAGTADGGARPGGGGEAAAGVVRGPDAGGREESGGRGGEGTAGRTADVEVGKTAEAQRTQRDEALVLGAAQVGDDERIKAVAVRRNDNGLVVEHPMTHAQAQWQAMTPQEQDGSPSGPSMRDKLTDGFTTTQGRFLDRETAYRLAAQYLETLKSPTDAGETPWLESYNLRAAEGRQGELDRVHAALGAAELPVASGRAEIGERAGARPSGELVPAKSVAELVKENMGLAVTIANSYRNIPGHDFDNVLGEARKALVNAARGFDQDRGGAPFGAYAGTAIRNTLNNLFNKNARTAAREVGSADVALGDDADGPTAKDNLVDERAQAAVSSGIEGEETRAALAAALADLPERVRTVLTMLGEGAGLREIGKAIGLSHEMARRILPNAKKALEARLRERGFKGVDADGVLYSAQISTPEFKAWFGDSKVVDADGKPLVVYRGEQSGSTHEVFDRAKTRENALFFSPSKEAASGYDQNGDARSFFLRSEKLLDLDGDDYFGEGAEWAQKWGSQFDEWIDRASGEAVNPFDVIQSGRLFDYEGDWSSRRWRDLFASAMADGYDGVKVPDTLDGITQPIYVVFDPRQVKSATGNSGAFDPSDPNILHAAAIADEEIREEADRSEAPEPEKAAKPQEYLKEVAVRWGAGRLDALDYAVPGAKNLLTDMHIKNARIDAGLRIFFERMEANVTESFGYPSWWREPANRKRLKRFIAELLPTAARLNAVAQGADGRMQFESFFMRAGELSGKQVKAMGMNGVPVTLREGVFIAGRHGEKLRVARHVETYTEGKKRDFWQLERLVEKAEQERLHTAFHERYPEAAHWLDSWINPNLKESRVTIGGIELPDFNRFSLREFWGEVSPFGEVGNVPGYTPDVFMTKSLVGMISQGVKDLLNRTWTGPGREYKSGEARERGQVRNLFEGFRVRAAEAHQETQRRALAEGLLKKALVDIPESGVPGNYARWDTETIDQLLRAYHAAQGLDPAEYSALKEKVRGLVSEELGKQENRKGDLGLPYESADVARIEKLAGRIAAEAAEHKGKMIHRSALAELRRPLASQYINNRLLRMIDGGLRGATSGYLANPFTLATNQLSNEIFITMHTLRRGLYGLMSLPFDAKQGKLGLYEAGNLLKGVITDRWYNKGIRELIPDEIFDGNHRFNTISGADFDKSPVELLRELNVSGAVLKAMRYGNVDARAKQRVAFASYMAHARIAYDEAQAAGKVSPAVKKGAWMKDWIENLAPDSVHRSAYNAAMLVAMDYANVPPALDETGQVMVGGRDVTAEVNMLRRGVAPFAKFPYNLARQGKRFTFDSLRDLLPGNAKVSGIEVSRGGVTTSAQKRQAAANLTMMGMLFILARALMDDDKDGTPKLGREVDDLGKRIEGAYQTSGRINITDTPLGKTITAALDMMGLHDLQEQEQWLRIRAFPYASSAVALATLEQMARGKPGGAEAEANVTAVLSDMVSEGILLKMLNAMRDEKGPYDQGKNTSFIAGETGFDMVTGRFVPPPLLRTLNALVDPIARRSRPVKSLDYDPGAVAAVRMKIPGAAREFPTTGAVRNGAEGSEKSQAAIAETLARELPEGNFRHYIDDKGKAKVAYVTPAKIQVRPRVLELLRAAGLNVKFVDKAEYERELAGVSP